ncbi:hypothetical protein [Deinococcus sp.]|uniref:hypothetical protein n=1 Tax=Deinococcus sp. TaxID=47478 RepID=UPI0025BE6929|nr:hypothetical protein [Deinococcus sp.]
MQKVGLYSLVALVVFALVFTLLPAAQQASDQTGATLRDVQLTLYPAHDQDAIWQFQAGNVQSDPLTGVTELAELSGGQRLVRQKDSAGQYTGRTTLDATLSTPHLTINAQDDITTPRARITLVSQCADIDLSGTPEQPVTIQQGVGFSAPLAVVDSPYLTGRLGHLQMDFQFQVLGSDQDSQISAPLDATETCRGGRRVPLT